MSRETRQRHSDKIAVLNRVRGHESSVAHSFNHTEGRCPKCARAELLLYFCHPDGENVGQVRGCELDGEHLHVMCATCKYTWIERPYDQAVLLEESGTTLAEGELACVLAAIALKSGGIRLSRETVTSMRQWKIHFHRELESDHITVTVEEPENPRGEVVHPSPEQMIGQDPGAA